VLAGTPPSFLEDVHGLYYVNSVSSPLSADSSRASTLSASETPFAPPTRGMVLDRRYELRHLLGEGGMGQVWEAEHLGLGRLLAVKIVDARYKMLHERLLREARVLASIRHPAIVEVFDVGSSPLGPFIVMERLQATPLDEMVAKGPLGVHRTLQLFLPVLEGLQLAHERGIVHRDIKPSNVLVTSGESGVAPLAKLLDFGIAVSSADPRLTQAGAILGTPAYMAPEQVKSARVDARTDVWGVAVTMLEAMSGRLVFDGEDAPSIMAKVLTEEVERPRHVDAIDDALWAIFESALRKEPEHRLSSARALGDALAAWKKGGSGALQAGVSRAAGLLPSAANVGDLAPDSLDALIRARLGDA
jgi:eukaryotic-like serine/threonine-protein kinase